MKSPLSSTVILIWCLFLFLFFFLWGFQLCWGQQASRTELPRWPRPHHSGKFPSPCVLLRLHACLLVRKPWSHAPFPSHSPRFCPLSCHTPSFYHPTLLHALVSFVCLFIFSFCLVHCFLFWISLQLRHESALDVEKAKLFLCKSDAKYVCVCLCDSRDDDDYATSLIFLFLLFFNVDIMSADTRRCWRLFGPRRPPTCCCRRKWSSLRCVAASDQPVMMC